MDQGKFWNQQKGYLSDSITVQLIDGCAHVWWTWRLYLRCLMSIASHSDILMILIVSSTHVCGLIVAWYDVLICTIACLFKEVSAWPRSSKLNLLSITLDSSIHSQQGPLKVPREQTLATQSYLSQHRPSSSLLQTSPIRGVCLKVRHMTIDSVNTTIWP
jgi:hypothetical protein